MRVHSTAVRTIDGVVLRPAEPMPSGAAAPGEVSP